MWTRRKLTAQLWAAKRSAILRGEIPATCRQLNTWSVQAMTDLVFVPTEPRNTSSANINYMLSQGKGNTSAANKTTCCRIADMATGLSNEFNPAGSLRQLGEWKAFVQQRCMERGSRTRELPLPPVWPGDGIATLVTVEDDIVTLKHRFTLEVINVTLDMGKVFSEETLYVGFNWSEERMSIASLEDRELKFTHRVCHYFETHHADNTLLRRRALAIEDGEVDVTQRTKQTKPHIATTTQQANTQGMMVHPSMLRSSNTPADLWSADDLAIESQNMWQQNAKLLMRMQRRSLPRLSPTTGGATRTGRLTRATRPRATKKLQIPIGGAHQTEENNGTRTPDNLYYDDVNDVPPPLGEPPSEAAGE